MPTKKQSKKPVKKLALKPIKKKRSLVIKKKKARITTSKQGYQVKRYAIRDVKHEAPETKERERLLISEGKRDEDIYSEEGMSELLDDDEIDPWEQGFMKGAKGRGYQGTCPYCGKVISQSKAKIFEKKVDGKILVFDSEECAKKYEKKKRSSVKI